MLAQHQSHAHLSAQAQQGSRTTMTAPTPLPGLLVLASTYPRWKGDHEPGFVHELCRRLAKDFNVIALVPDAPGAEADGALDGVEIVRYHYAPRGWQTLIANGGIVANLRRAKWKWLLLPGFVLAQYFAARRLIRERRVDVIHAHWLLPQGLIARWLSRRTGVPYLVTSHGGDLFGLRGRAPTLFKRKVAADCAAMTVVSSSMRDEAQRLGLHPPRIEVLPMGVDLQDRFIPDAAIPRAENQLLFVGRLVPKKGLHHLLDALPRVLASKPQTRLAIAGFGPQEASLKMRAKQLGIAHAVDFLGPLQQADLPALYRRAGVFVAPFVRDDSGDQEGLPVALMEAIGCGCPVVVGDVAGVHDLLGADADEIAVNPTDADALCAALLAALDAPERARTRALALRQRIVGKVDWDVIAAGYSQVLRGVVGRQ
jgi:glycosyltransferase involved in cell wall biosynthesis